MEDIAISGVGGLDVAMSGFEELRVGNSTVWLGINLWDDETLYSSVD